MPAPIGPPGPATTNVRQIADYIRAEVNAGNVEKIGEFSRVAVRSLATNGALALESASSAGDIAAAEAAGAAASEFASICIIPVLVAILGILDITLAFARVPAHVSIPFIGHPFSGFADWLYGKVDIVYQAVYGEIENAAKGIIVGFLGLFGYAVDASGRGAVTVPGHVTAAQYTHVQNEADQLWKWLQLETLRINQLSAAIHGTVHIPAGTPLSIRQLLEAQSGQIELLKGEIHRLDSDLAHTNATVRQLATDLGQLSAHMTGTQAVHYSVPDISTYITHISDQAAAENAKTAANVDKLAITVGTLIPLGALLNYGARGVNNLVRLSDDVCQCPRLPHIPDLLPEILAADMALKDGI